MKKYVLVFDICSSTSMLEDLVLNEQPEKFNRLIQSFDDFINNKSNDYAIHIYKFLGDGYILFIDASITVDKILEFFIELVGFVKSVIEWFSRDFITTTQLPRIGITAGLEKGNLHTYRSRFTKQSEYIGRALNVAYRLQSSQTAPDHVNRLLLSAKLYLQLKEYLLRIACSERERILKNINDENPIRCYEFNPDMYPNLNIVEPKSHSRKFAEYIKKEKGKVERLSSLYTQNQKHMSYFQSTYGKEVKNGRLVT